MSKSRFAESPIVQVLKRVEGRGRVKRVCRETGVSEAMDYQGKSKYDGMWRPRTSDG